MAVNSTDVRETIGINDKPISVCAIQEINIIEPNYKETKVGTSKRRDASSLDLTAGMIIAVHTGSNPNKQQDVEMDK